VQFDPVVPRYNVAPSQPVLTVISPDQVQELIWGLIPSWSKIPKAIINARAETLDDKASFRESFENRRCLVLADGFYEWKRVGKARQAFYFQMKDEHTFAFAGIWDRWKNGDVKVKSCAIVTTDANEVLAPVHDRMPVILREEAYERWLDPKVSPTELKKLLEPYPGEEMKSHPVSSQVNFADAEGKELIERVDAEVGTTPSLF